MKISPIATGGQHGQSLTSTHVGRTADPVKMEKARAIARGEKVEEQAQPQPQVEMPRQDVRKLTMRTNYSTNREEIPVEQAPEVPAEQTPQPQSSTPDTVEQGAVEATQPLSPQFAALAKQKRALQLERAELDKLKAELAQNKVAPVSDQLAEKLKSDPMSVLQEHGVLNPEFYNSLTERLLNEQQGINPEIQATIQTLKEEIKTLKEGVDKSFQTREAQQEEAALTEILYEAEALAKEGDAFELIREQDAYDKVLRLIHKTYKDTGRVLGTTEAMNRVENELLAQAEKLARLGKVQSKVSPQPPQLQPQQRQMRTLTARDSVAPTLDRRARAINAFNGNTKR